MDDIESIALKVLDVYPVKRAAFFGSAARGDMTAGSDIDMLVEFLPDTRGILFFSLQTDLERAFNRSVDGIHLALEIYSLVCSSSCIIF